MHWKHLADKKKFFFAIEDSIQKVIYEFHYMMNKRDQKCYFAAHPGNKQELLLFIDTYFCLFALM